MGSAKSQVLKIGIWRAVLATGMVMSFASECGIGSGGDFSWPREAILPAGSSKPYAQIWLFARVIAPHDGSLIVPFNRTWLTTGPSLCGAMGAAGFDMTEWKAASLRSITYECNYLRFFDRDQSRSVRSAFLRIRGNVRGEILDIRGTLVDPPTDPDGGLPSELMRLFDTIIEQTRWMDLKRVLPSIRRLENTEAENFGAKFRFFREHDVKPRYSVSLSVQRAPDAPRHGSLSFRPAANQGIER